MNTIKDIFQQAQLAEAAYADFSNPTVSDYQALINGNFSSAQAADFVAHWKVVDHVPDLGSGFSATIFEQLDESGNGTGQFDLAIRGSRQLVDFAADVALIVDQGVAVAQLVDLYNFWQRAQTPAGNSYMAAVLASGDSVIYVDSSQLSDVEMQTGSGAFAVAPTSINVTGHSLGGHLAMAFTRLFPNIDANAISVNGLGFKTENSTVDNLFVALNGDSQFNASQIQNVYGINGYEFAAQDSLLLQQVGAYDGIFIESAGIDTYGGHSSSQMTDTLAVYNLFSQVDPSLSIDEATAILKTSAYTADHTLESAVTALGELFVTGFTPRTGSEYDSKRDDLYTDIDAISSVLENTSGLSIEVLSTTDTEGNVTPFSPYAIESNARTDIAYRYALVNLNPFAVVGANYANFNQNDELDIYDSATGDGQLSNMYLADRAEMLANLIYCNIYDTNDAGGDGSPILYTDIRVDEEDLNIYAGKHQTLFDRAYYTFGSEKADTLAGTSNADHLYGMSGNDTLSGFGGEDYLEGGADNDILIGGKDNDILVGGKGNDTYFFALGDGNDTILDSDGQGSIVITDANGNIIEVAVGDFTRTDVGIDEWGSASGNITLTHAASWVLALSDGSTITLDSFKDGDLGINLVDNFAQTPEPFETTSDIFGDPLIHSATVTPGAEAADWHVVEIYNREFEEDGEGNQVLVRYDVDYYLVDDNGNPTEDGGEEQDDVLYDTINNDHFMSGGGNDVIELNQGGDDYVETGSGEDVVNVNSDGNHTIDMGADDDDLHTFTANPGNLTVDGGSGRDYLGGGSGQDLIVGGEGADCLYGSGGDDRLYGDAEGTVADLIAQGSIEEGAGLQGELVDAEDGNDQIFTGSGNDFIAGGDGADLIVSGGGDDYICGDQNIYVFSGADWKDWMVMETITAPDGGSILYDYNYVNFAVESNTGTGNDTIFAGAGNDIVKGEGGDDTIYLEAGNDKSWGGAGADIILGGAGDDMLNGDNGVSQLSESLHGDDFLDGGDGNDDIHGMGGSDILYGGAGDDTLSGDSSNQEVGGNDYLNGEDGNDTLLGGAGDDILLGGEGVDILVGQDGNDLLYGGLGNDELQGGNDNDYLYGDADNDLLFGEAGDDVLDGGVGDDQLQGGDGNDYLYGDADNDLLFGEAGNDLLDGGDGDDQLIGGDGDDSLYGGSENDLLIGDNGDGTGTGRDYLYGEDGDDELQGGGGDDTLYGDADNDVLFGQDGDDILHGGTGNDQLQGGDGNDILIGGSGDDFLIPGNGNDMMDGGDGDDTYYFALGSGIKRLQDSGGYNRLILQGGIGLNSINLSLGSLMIGTGVAGDELHLDGVDYDDLINTSPINSIEFTDGQTLTIAEVVEAVGIDYATTEGADTVTGTSARDNIDALAGDDVINSGGGNDIIDLGDGDDSADAGAGNDSVVAGTGADTVMAGAGDDTVSGGAGADTLYGNEGVDLLRGGDDNDSLFGGDDNDLLYGDLGDDVLSGDAGNDVLDGGAGGDVMAGGTGDDTYYVDSATDSITEEIESGTDLVISDIDYVLGNHLENLQLAEASAAVSATGNSLANSLTGNSLDNTLLGLAGNDLLSGGEGDDTLDGGAGADIMMGGAGDDQYFVDDALDSISEEAGAGTDLVTATVSHTLADNVENLVLSGTAAVSGFGNILANKIYGNELDNRLSGAGGADELYGESGDDILIGGSGADYMVGGTGNDTYNVDDLSDTVVENADEGIDTVESTIDYTLLENVEHLTLSGDADISGTGNDNANILVGNSGNNQLSGTGGNDELYGGDGADVLNGGSGSDTLYGETGDDTYVIDSLEDTLVELADEGNDTVESSVDYTLIENIENLVLTGSAETAIGNNLDNRLTGNDLNNTLDGGAGSDILAGGLGDDTYLTQTIGDQILENNYAGFDTEIRSYESSENLAQNVEALRLTAGIVQGVGNNLNNVLIGNEEDNILTGLAGDDVFDGGAGADILAGGSGNDTYIDDGADVIVEYADEGTDTIESIHDVVLGDYLENVVLRGDASVNATGNALDNVLIGNSANNVLDGGLGGDWLAGGAGDDTYYTDSEADGIYETVANGVDTEIRSHETLHLLSANVENLILAGTVYRGNGNALDNLIQGNAADNNLWGREGNDILYGNAGNDQLIGAEGDDELVGGIGNDLLSGGTGNDTLYGSDGADQLDGGAGINLLRGGLGDDVYVYGADGGLTTIDNSDGGTDWLIFTDDLTLDRLSFVRSNDDLIVRIDDNTEKQVVISNWFLGGDYQIDYIQPDGENGIPAAQIEALLAGGASGFDTVVEGTDAAEQLVGSTGNDQINGYAGDDQLFGLAGADELNGGEGADYLDGGAGDDVQSGGAGNDQLGGDAGNDTLIGGTGDDIYVYTSGSGADTIDNSDGGADWLIFTDITSDRLTYVQTGADLIVRVDDDAATQVTVSSWFAGSEYQLAYIQPSGESGIAASAINALFESPGGGTTAIPPESDFDTVVTGTEGAEQLVGTSGMDLLQGLAGDDQLFGLSGNDWLVAGDGADYLDGGAGDDVQLGEAGNDQLGGDVGNDTLVGGSGDDIYVYRPDSGADIIDNSGGGTDWLIFTDDITAERLSYHRFGDDLQVRVDGDETTMVTVKHWFDGDEYKLSYIQPAGGYGISAASIESMLSTTPDSGFDALLTGTDDADTLTGSPMAEQLYGYGGDDQLSGLSGNDELSGDDGNDTLSGGAGDDSYLFNLGDGSDIIADESGIDSIAFGDEVSSAGFAFLKSGTTLQIGYGIDDQITMGSYSDSTTGNRIETITLADGSTMTDADINQIIQEMSAYASTEGISLDSLADVRNNEELMTIVASGWQAA